jgi:arylsulfatase A-like enzyme
MIESMDDAVGTLLDALDKFDLANKTIVIFTSDNGGLHVPEGTHQRITHNTPFRAGKGYVYEGGLRIPLLVRWPGRVPAGRVVGDPVINTDWVPTLLELVGAPPPAGLDGVSFASFLTGRGPAPARPFFWHFPHYNNQGGRPTGAMRSGPWMLVEYYDEPRAELFDLDVDCREERDLAAQQPARVAEMRAALEAWRRQVGAQINQPNPNCDPAKFRELYVDLDPSRFEPARAFATTWERIWEWRRGMNSVVQAGGKKGKKSPR